ncbi:protein of unknown function [Oenococcus oeni]|uniref:Uncharacterized protein n=1 Tax=Oenococcus oeni TaxID=1247 RepID=A0AAQ2USG8_OENOE|nr:hypothetical protein OENI_300019 [Oenococcus oeni]SYW03208.1 hypothetical protein OENI_60105 [Oenococcus oeni]SYW04909.1 hypothetical protein OENI_40108 [Oenococcus oeni]SYW07352.1 hypothetical protein OENI_620004 [Oenococcus oeni]SYW09154.1 hypothetical protein OENI_60042 [Oenococcus oeni]
MSVLALHISVTIRDLLNHDSIDKYLLIQSISAKSPFIY